MANSRVQSPSRQSIGLLLLVSFILVPVSPIVMATETGEYMEKPKQEIQHYFDHFAVGIADLDKGMDLIEGMTGVRPVYGGVHPTIGTHNALISLGGHTYLEIIAPNPDADSRTKPDGAILNWHGAFITSPRSADLPQR